MDKRRRWLVVFCRLLCVMPSSYCYPINQKEFNESLWSRMKFHPQTNTATHSPPLHLAIRLSITDCFGKINH
ncbi:hypothetical protein C366_06149 [Cryptococcus neoformans Tu401-1]|nr:hypothetical protein C366_06149 [Cryptococcus neoformans var. grubii Tu401-1]OXM76288.1 hypothetical protein C364_06121 [Cryptococcus neoformans var. grubii Bt63]